jgi:translation initiation factor 2B subunit (eIF-2B alpha/beta/delta family)
MRKFVLSAPDMANFQKDIPYRPMGAGEDEFKRLAESFDYTPSRFVTLLLTEKGPMPPSAVTHELTKLLGVS